MLAHLKMSPFLMSLLFKKNIYMCCHFVTLKTQLIFTRAQIVGHLKSQSSSFPFCHRDQKPLKSCFEEMGEKKGGSEDEREVGSAFSHDVPSADFPLKPKTKSFP